MRVGSVIVHHGDCVQIAPKIGVIDAIVTDPPYHLFAPRAAHMDFALTGSGRPRQSNVIKTGFMGQRWDGGDIAFRPETWAAIGAALKPGGYLLAFGSARTHHRIWCAIEDSGLVIQDTIMWLYGSGFPKGRTQLKPAFEPICVAYKPGGKRTLQIDECRVGIDGGTAKVSFPKGKSNGIYGDGINGACEIVDLAAGRWPANLAHDGSDEVMAAFAAFGEAGGGGRDSRGRTHEAFSMDRPRIAKRDDLHPGFGKVDSPARFYYCGKATKADRYGSKHPTVKPVALMRWLVRLVTPPGGTVLDPFAGSGTTGAAAIAEGRKAILIEREAEYIADIRRRLKAELRDAA